MLAIKERYRQIYDNNLPAWGFLHMRAFGGFFSNAHLVDFFASMDNIGNLLASVAALFLASFVIFLSDHSADARI